MPTLRTLLIYIVTPCALLSPVTSYFAMYLESLVVLDVGQQLHKRIAKLADPGLLRFFHTGLLDKVLERHSRTSCLYQLS